MPSSQGGGKWYEKNPDEVEWTRGGQKWQTLEWAGVVFPPLYEPHGVEFRYKGKKVPLSPDQEEVATMYAAMLSTEYVTNAEKGAVFNKNFMESWRPLLKKTEEGKEVKDLALCDFSKIKEHLDEIAAKKKELTAAEKKAAKIEKDKFEEPYLYALVDGRKEKVGNFRVEPPGLFRGRGAHPKMGKLKARIFPEDVSLNMSKKAKVRSARAARRCRVSHLATLNACALLLPTTHPTHSHALLPRCRHARRRCRRCYAQNNRRSSR
jgi:DNA topoisomerase-1